MSGIDQHQPVDWKTHGVRVIPGDQLDPNTAQTPGMDRAAAINFARVGAQKIWAGTVKIHPNAKTGAHHHGALESVIYVVKGRARMRWGEHLEYVAEAGPGDFIFVPPYVPHQEINASTDEPLDCVVIRSDNEAIVVNLDIEPVERPEEVRWVDPIHHYPYVRRRAPVIPPAPARSGVDLYQILMIRTHAHPVIARSEATKQSRPDPSAHCPTRLLRCARSDKPQHRF